MTDTTDTARKLFAEYAVLDEYDRTRSPMGHDYGSGQRGAELMRRRRSLRMIGLDVELDEIEHPSKEELSAAFERVGRPKLRRAESELFRRETPATSRTLKAWAMVERWSTGARVAATPPASTEDVIEQAAAVAALAESAAAGDETASDELAELGYSLPPASTEEAVARAAGRSAAEQLRERRQSRELRTESRKAAKRSQEERESFLRELEAAGVIPGARVEVAGSYEGGKLLSLYRGVVFSVRPSGTVIVDDESERDGAGTPIRHYVSRAKKITTLPDRDVTKLSETGSYRRIAFDLGWLDRNVRLDPAGFAADHLADVERQLRQLVEAVAEGTI